MSADQGDAILTRDNMRFLKQFFKTDFKGLRVIIA